MSARALVGVVAAVLFAASCEVSTPLAPAEPIGEVPRWGESFQQPKDQPSLLGGGMIGNTSIPQGTASPGATGDWSGGDPTLGKGLYTTMCARCHGALGEGGKLPTGAAVPPLADATWQDKTEDRFIARSIAMGKGEMPSFMRELDKPKLMALVAYIRTLKK